MRTMRSSRGVSDASTRVVVSRRFDWIAVPRQLPLAMSALPLPAQAIDATQALNRWAGVSKPKVLRGRSFSCRATLFSCACEYIDKSASAPSRSPLGANCRHLGQFHLTGSDRYPRFRVSNFAQSPSIERQAASLFDPR